MGLFDWMFGGRAEPSRVTVLPDRIWLTPAAKTEGMAEEVRNGLRAHAAPVAVLLVAHFEDSLPTVAAIAEREEFEGCPVHVVMADRLNRPFESDVEQDDSRWMLVLVCERHPLRHRDDAVGTFAGNLPCRAELAFHLSLEDPVPGSIMGPWVKSMLERLGMSESEAIESRMVTRRIAAAQKKLAAAAVGDEPTRSVEEWFRRNCPEFAVRDNARDDLA